MFKYQEEVVKQLTETAELLENVTDERKAIKIGSIRDEQWINGWNGGWKEYSGDLYLRINSSYRFGVEDEYHPIYIQEFDNIDSDAHLSLKNDIFIQMVKWIDKIYKNEKERRFFYEELSKELKSLNKSIKRSK